MNPHSYATEISAVIMSPGRRAAHSTRAGTPSATIHSLCRTPVRKPAAPASRVAASSSARWTSPGRRDGTVCPVSTGRRPGCTRLSVTLPKMTSPSTSSSSTLCSRPSSTCSTRTSVGSPRSVASGVSSGAAVSAQAAATCSGSLRICTPRLPERRVGFSTHRPPCRRANAAARSGSSTSSKAGLTMPAPAATSRIRCLSVNTSAASTPAPGRPRASASRAAAPTAYSRPGITSRADASAGSRASSAAASRPVWYSAATRREMKGSRSARPSTSRRRITSGSSMSTTLSAGRSSTNQRSMPWEVPTMIICSRPRSRTIPPVVGAGGRSGTRRRRP